MKKYQQLALAALLGNMSLSEVKALSLQSKSTTCDFDEWNWDDEEETTTPATQTTDSGSNPIQGSNRRRCSKGWGDDWDCGCNQDCDCGWKKKNNCCPCQGEFEEVHCSMDDLCDKLCCVIHS
jgi:hypothetical protein